MRKRLSTVRHDARMFGDHRVPRRQVRSQDAHQLVVREVPRLNSHQYTDGVMLDPRVAEVGFILYRCQKLFRVVGVIAGDLRAQFHLVATLFDELTHLLTGNFGQILRAFLNQISKFVQHRQTLVDIAFRPVGVVERIGRFQRLVDIRVGVGGIFFDELVSSRIYCLVSHIESPLITA